MNHLQPQGRSALQSVLQKLGRLLNSGRNEGPPDLDELWRDFKRKFASLFNLKGGGNGGGTDGGGPPNMRGAGIGLGVAAGLVLVVWLGSGIFTVQEGQEAVITTFGKYTSTVGAGIQWRLPYPFQDEDVVSVTQLQQVDVGDSSLVAATGLRDSSMLTEDENIVDILFTVQYTVKDARDFLFNNAVSADDSVKLAAESAVREIVGQNLMDAVLYEQRDAIANELSQSVQAQLDRLHAGILVKNVNVKSVQPPEQVQAAFDDAFKATANREQMKNEAQAYANNTIPEAQGYASALLEQAQGYKESVVATADGDAQRFRSVLAEYQKAPIVTRDRLYLDAMRQVYSSVTKVMVDSHNGSNLLYLPLDKLMQMGANNGANVAATPTTITPATTTDASSLSSGDSRARDSDRSRDRDGR